MKKYLYIMFILLLCSCNKESNCMERAQSNASKTIDVPLDREIKFIVLYDDIGLEITQENTCCKLSIEGPQNLLDAVTVEFLGDTLILGNKNKCYWNGKLQSEFTAKVSLKELYRIENNSSGNITTKNTFSSGFFWMDFYGSSGDVDMNLDVNELIILQHTGMSNINLSGKAQSLDLLTGAKGIGKFENLESPKIFLRQFGSGDTYIQSKDSLWIEIRGLGDVYLKGNPDFLQLDRKGQGNLIQL